MASGLNEEQISQLAAERIRASLAVKEGLLAPQPLAEITSAATLVGGALRDGRKLLIFGNGGSAADAEHIAGEFVGRFVAERRALPAIAVSVSTSVLTAIANDYSFEAGERCVSSPMSACTCRPTRRRESRRATSS